MKVPKTFAELHDLEIVLKYKLPDYKEVIAVQPLKPLQKIKKQKD